MQHGVETWKLFKILQNSKDKSLFALPNCIIEQAAYCFG